MIRTERVTVWVLGLWLTCGAAQADIYQWEWVGSVPGQGKRQSSILCVDGAGVSPAPSADLSGRDLSMAYLIGVDLESASLVDARLPLADLTGAYLSSVDFENTILSGAVLGGAILNEADFSSAMVANADLSGVLAHETVFDSAMLSNSSLAGADLENARFTQAILGNADFTGANLHGADLSSAMLSNTTFCGAVITNADFSDTTIRGFLPTQLYSTVSYEGHNLKSVNLADNNLTGWSFVGQDLEGASFQSAELQNADFTDASVVYANFAFATNHGFSPQQLYSTASYRHRQLSAICLNGNTLDRWDFAGQGLYGADFQNASLVNTNLQNTYLLWADFYLARLTGTDLRGAKLNGGELDRAILRNTIRADGHIDGLVLDGDDMLLVRDINPGMAVKVLDEMSIDAGATLCLVFEDAEWGSTIVTDGIAEAVLGGNLELTFAEGVDPETLTGVTFDLFDWGDTQCVGEFDVVSEFTWDTSQLYTTGEVRLLALSTMPGDANGDGEVDAADAAVLAAHWLSTVTPGEDGDFNGDGIVNDRDASILAANWTGGTDEQSVPEPSTWAGILSGLLVLSAAGRRARRRR
ncbi:MAG: pentapeptide repeat-containing protein [Pirellulales bacterium]|nr:pentapeptide repeat-containing protein [Pirellulales bacterium]